MSSAASTSSMLPTGRGTSLMDRINLAIQFRRYFKIIARRWLIVFLATVAGLSYYSYQAFTTPDLYRATSLVGLAEKVKTTASSEAQYLEAMDEFYERQLVFIKNQVVLSRVQSRMLESGTNFGTGQIRRYDASKVRGSSFALVVEGTNLKQAQLFAKLWADEFIKFKDESRKATMDKSGVATHETILRYEQKLEEARAAQQDFRRKHNIGSAREAGISAQQRLDRLLEEQLSKRTQWQLLEKQTKEDIASGGLSTLPRPQPDKKEGKSVASFQEIDSLVKLANESQFTESSLQLRSKKVELQQLQQTLKPKHPVLIKLAKEIGDLEQRLQFQLELVEKRRLALIKSLKAEDSSYDTVIAALKKEVINSQSVQDEYKRLEEEEQRLQNTLNQLRTSLLSVDLASNEEEQFRIIETGVPVGRIGPNRQKMIFTGLLLGLGVGLGIVYFLHRMDDRLDLAEDIEAALEEPVLGQIPQVDMQSIKEGYLLIHKLSHHNLFAESIRGVRSAVMLGAENQNRKILLVTSAVPGDGKTTFTVNFASTLATAGHCVLLVDADLRRGNTHYYFNQEREPGLSEILMGQHHWSDLVKTTEISTLGLISSGKLPPNPGELLIGPNTKPFMEEIRQTFDYIIFDCPPLTAIDDTFSLVGFSDGLLFVVRAGQTSMRFAKHALAAVRQRGTHIMGVILNGITTDNPYYYYHNYYHAYYNKLVAQQLEFEADRPISTESSSKPRRAPTLSIEQEAKARAGQEVNSKAYAEFQKAKAEEFKIRRNTGFFTKSSIPPTPPHPPKPSKQS